jgi:hypothetical protein
VREHGDTNLLIKSCPPIIGLKEIVEFTQLTVEGTITVAESRRTAKEDEVYTEYEIEVIRLFRQRGQRCAASARRADRAARDLRTIYWPIECLVRARRAP